MNAKQKVAIYEKALHEAAEWGLKDEDMPATDDNGAMARWAREVLRLAGEAKDDQ